MKVKMCKTILLAGRMKIYTCFKPFLRILYLSRRNSLHPQIEYLKMGSPSNDLSMQS